MKRTAAVAVAAVTTVLSVLVPAPGASADGQGSSTSHVVGRGDIVTSILGASRSRGRRGRGGDPPVCVDHVFSDAEIEFLVAFIAHDPDSVKALPLTDLIRDHLAGRADRSATSYDIEARICDGVMVSASAVPSASIVGLGSIIGRRMITRLPEPIVIQSPPPEVPVPINEPVFVSIPATEWKPVEATLSAAGVVAEVRAEPISLRLYTGEMDAPFQDCAGRGVAFNLWDRASPEAQARRPGACVMTYGHMNRDDGTTPAEWMGTISVLWSAQWRTNDGPWISLGVIPRTRVIERKTREVITAIGGVDPRGRAYSK